MEHWSDRYLLAAYPPDYDCADLVVDVMRDVFSRSVDLPAHARTVRSRDRQIMDEAAERGVRVATADARDGDAVLMRSAARARPVGHHVGVWCDGPGVPHVLHHLDGIGVCRHRPDELGRCLLEIVEVYRWT